MKNEVDEGSIANARNGRFSKIAFLAALSLELAVESEPRDEAARHVDERPYLTESRHDHETAGPIRGGRLSDDAAEQRAEGAETLEADFEADVGDGMIPGRQQLPRALEPALLQVFVRRLLELALELPQEVIARQMRFSGDGVEVQRLIEAVVDEATRAHEPIERSVLSHEKKTLA
jgi:hypothetical protein